MNFLLKRLLIAEGEVPNEGSMRTSHLGLYTLPIGIFIACLSTSLGLNSPLSIIMGGMAYLISQFALNRLFQRLEKKYFKESKKLKNAFSAYLDIIIFWAALLIFSIWLVR